MIEMYLFVEPSCSECLRAEKAVTKIAKNISTNISLKFIPFMNLGVLNPTDQSKPNSYELILDYKAALFQGCKKGRQFLASLQQKIFIEGASYNKTLVYDIAKQINLDLEMFKEDRHSQLIINTFKADQELMSEMNIVNHGNLVIFDCTSDNNGLLIEKVDYSQLHNICQKIINKDSLKNLNQTHNLRVL